MLVVRVAEGAQEEVISKERSLYVLREDVSHDSANSTCLLV